MQRSSEPIWLRIARNLLSVTLVAGIAGLAWFILEGGATPPPPKQSPAVAAPQGFAGASTERTFLTERESLAAGQRGLLPSNTRSVIDTGGQMAFGDWYWDDKGVPPGPLAIRVDLERQLVSVFRGPHEIGTAVIVYGIDGKETPRGRLPIRGKTRDYHSITYDAPMPYSLWLREDGVALHGSSVAMGKATNGCIGVPVEFAEKLFDAAETGDIVEVLASPIKSDRSSTYQRT